MLNFQDTFETRKPSFISAFSVCMTVPLKIAMNIFTAETGSLAYHVYREITWRNVSLHQQVKVLKETNSMSIDTDPCCCKITIKRVGRIGDITVGHIPRELLRFVFYFIHEGGSVTGTFAT